LLRKRFEVLQAKPIVGLRENTGHTPISRERETNRPHIKCDEYDKTRQNADDILPHLSAAACLCAPLAWSVQSWPDLMTREQQSQQQQ